MSPDRRGGQPQREVELLIDTPKISLPHYVKDLAIHLQTLGEIIYENRSLYVTKGTEYDHDDLPTGTIYVHEKANGLPNYSAEYIREGNNIYIDGARFWSYELIESPRTKEKSTFGHDPILASRETILYQPSDNDPEGILTRRVSALDPYKRDELVLGREEKSPLLGEAPFDQTCTTLLKTVYEQMTRIPNLQIMPFEEIE